MSSSGSLAILTASRRASSRVSRFHGHAPAALVFEIDIGQGLAGLEQMGTHGRVALPPPMRMTHQDRATIKTSHAPVGRSPSTASAQAGLMVKFN
jgi:hypothetical protein